MMPARDIGKVKSRRVKAREEILHLAYQIKQLHRTARRQTAAYQWQIRKRVETELMAVLHDALLSFPDRFGGDFYEGYIETAEYHAEQTGVKHVILFDPRRFAHEKDAPFVYALALRSVRDLPYRGEPWHSSLIMYKTRHGKSHEDL